MKAIRHLPLAVLLLMLIAAVTAISVGWHMARVEKEVIVVKDEAPLLDFASEFGEEVKNLQLNLERTLLEFGRGLTPEMSDRSVVDLAQTYTGLKLVVKVKRGSLGKEDWIDQSWNVEGDFPLPRVGGKNGINLEQLDEAEVVYFWEDAKSGQSKISYFVMCNWRDKGSVLILGIERNEVLSAMDSWLGRWAEKAHAPLVEGGLNHCLLSSRGTYLLGDQKTELRPDTVYPITTRLGSWQLKAWHERKLVVEIREEILRTAAVLAMVLFVIGVFAFFLLKRSVAVAMQRVSFVNQVSHELRTPLTNMMLNLDLAKEVVQEEGMAARRLGLMGEELGRLQRLLENVLTFSRREEKLVREKLDLDLRDEVGRALRPMEEAMARENISVKITLAEDLMARGDRDALTQVLGNLFSNVLKYGGDELLVKGEIQGEMVMVWICDSGSGVAARDREKIFKPFLRLSDRIDEGVSGSGLGLSIARDLVGAMEGELRCVDRPDGKVGGCFELRLPAKVSEAEILPFESKVS